MSEDLEEQFGQPDFINDLDRGANNLNEWLKNSPNVKALVNSVMPEVQEVNDAQSDVYSTINIFEAVGTQLDDIFGTLLEEPRESGQTDSSYRTTLLGAVPRLSKSGEITTMKGLYRDMALATSVSLIEYDTATFIMNAQVPDPNRVEVESIREELKKSKQGGNLMDLSISIDTTPFTFMSIGDTPNPSLGFASLALPESGGTFGSLLPQVYETTFLLTNDDKFLTTNDGKKLVFFGGV